jgi:hypothetical protein
MLLDLLSRIKGKETNFLNGFLKFLYGNNFGGVGSPGPLQNASKFGLPCCYKAVIDWTL